jgi:SAM-dependent methyltransferase
MYESESQFYWRTTPRLGFPENIAPDFLPLRLFVNEEYGLVQQVRDPVISKWLDLVYEQNCNVGYLQDGHELADSYGLDFLAFLTAAISKYYPQAKEIFEIGSGGGWLLRRLRDKGFSIRGCDPSPIAEDDARKHNYPLTREFYNLAGEYQQADVIVHYDVLEHIHEPVHFLDKHLQHLSSNGLIVFAVPDCSPYIKNADISMFLHEHLNYFDFDSIASVVSKAGIDLLEIASSKVGGVLYCVGRFCQGELPQLSGSLRSAEWSDRVQANVNGFQQFLGEAMTKGQSIGAYIPLRIFPYLGTRIANYGIRFFDDDSGLHGRYFDGTTNPVENSSQLLSDPPSIVLLLSSAYGTRIENRLRSEGLPKETNFFTLDSLTKYGLHQYGKIL